MAGVVVDLAGRLPLRVRGPVPARTESAPLLTCPLCGSAQFTVLRHEYLGRATQWWCLHCQEPLPPLSLVR